MTPNNAPNTTPTPLRDVLIPEMLSVTPRHLGTVENDYASLTQTPGERLWLTATGTEWRALRAEGKTLPEIAQHANHNGLRYRYAAVELFFLLAERAVASGWEEAYHKACEGYPKTYAITPDGVTEKDGAS